MGHFGKILPNAKGNPRHRHTPGTMNKMEERYSKELDLQVAAGRIVKWWFEEWKFKLGADKIWYTPDFVVMTPDGTLEVHECKGWMEGTAAIKIKLMRAAYPFTFKLVREVRKAFEIETFPSEAVA